MVLVMPSHHVLTATEVLLSAAGFTVFVCLELFIILSCQRSAH